MTHKNTIKWKLSAPSLDAMKLNIMILPLDWLAPALIHVEIHSSSDCLSESAWPSVTINGKCSPSKCNCRKPLWDPLRAVFHQCRPFDSLFISCHGIIRLIFAFIKLHSPLDCIFKKSIIKILLNLVIVKWWAEIIWPGWFFSDPLIYEGPFISTNLSLMNLHLNTTHRLDCI